MLQAKYEKQDLLIIPTKVIQTQTYLALITRLRGRADIGRALHNIRGVLGIMWKVGHNDFEGCLLEDAYVYERSDRRESARDSAEVEDTEPIR